jgi:hypothetical protein
MQSNDQCTWITQSHSRIAIECKEMSGERGEGVGSAQDAHKNVKVPRGWPWSRPTHIYRRTPSNRAVRVCRACNRRCTPRPSLGWTPRVLLSQISNGRFPTNRCVCCLKVRASDARQTRSSKLPIAPISCLTRPLWRQQTRTASVVAEAIGAADVESNRCWRPASVASTPPHPMHARLRAPQRRVHQTLTSTFDAHGASVRRVRITPVTSPPFPSSVAMENKRFISAKTPNPSLPLKLHRLRKCANTTEFTSPCARVLAFSQSFFKALR